MKHAPRSTLLQRRRNPLGHLRRRLGQFPNKLPVRAHEQEDEDDVHKQEQEVLLQERILDPAPRAIALHVAQRCSCHHELSYSPDT